MLAEVESGKSHMRCVLLSREWLKHAVAWTDSKDEERRVFCHAMSHVVGGLPVPGDRLPFTTSCVPILIKVL